MGEQTIRRQQAAAVQGGPQRKCQGGAPKVGDRAPDFTLADQTGTMVRLGEFVGKKRVVLAFYIKAFTPT
jgi:peroxiredoxin